MMGVFSSPFWGGGYHFWRCFLTFLPVAHGFRRGPWGACVTPQWLFVNPSSGLQVAN